MSVTSHAGVPRRTLLHAGAAGALTVGLGGLGLLRSPYADAASTLGGPISRDEVIARADIWFKNPPGSYTYDGSGYSPGPGGDKSYRRDCSGFVDMAWHLNSAAATGTLANFTDSIDRSDLRAGDILLNRADHVFLFERWLDNKGNFSYYTFGSDWPQHLTTNIWASTMDGHPNNSYTAERYRKIFDAAPPAPPAYMPYEAGRIVSARSKDGRLEAWAAAADGVWHCWQTAANGKWAPWENTGGPQGATLAIAPNADGRLEVFALNSAVMQHIWQLAPSGKWSAWADFGTGGHGLAAGANQDGRIEVFATNPNGVFHKWQTSASAWSAWSGSAAGDNGPADAELEIAMSPDGRLEVFALNKTRFGHLFQTKASGGWGAWENFGTGGYDLTVDRNSDGRLEVFASGSQGVFRKWQTSATAWSAWKGTGGPANSKLSSERTPDGRIECFAINGSVCQHSYQLKVDGDYSGWNDFGGGGSDIVTTKNQDGRIEVLASNPNGIFHSWQTGFSTWGTWGWLASNAGPGQATIGA